MQKSQEPMNWFKKKAKSSQMKVLNREIKSNEGPEQRDQDKLRP